MSDKPIIFSRPMIKALLEGRKTQTRRVLKPQPKPGQSAHKYQTAEIDWQVRGEHGTVISSERLPFRLGDRLWVREAHYLTDDGHDELAIFAADDDAVSAPAASSFHPHAALGISPDSHRRLRPSIHMPRWASRLTLTVTEVRVERLQDISEEDVVAEGIPWDYLEHLHGPGGFRDLWNDIHGPDAWALNPWVAAISFSVERRNIDADTKTEIAA